MICLLVLLLVSPPTLTPTSFLFFFFPIADIRDVFLCESPQVALWCTAVPPKKRYNSQLPLNPVWKFVIIQRHLESFYFNAESVGRLTFIQNYNQQGRMYFSPPWLKLHRGNELVLLPTVNRIHYNKPGQQAN